MNHRTVRQGAESSFAPASPLRTNHKACCPACLQPATGQIGPVAGEPHEVRVKPARTLHDAAQGPVKRAHFIQRDL